MPTVHASSLSSPSQQQHPHAYPVDPAVSTNPPMTDPSSESTTTTATTTTTTSSSSSTNMLVVGILVGLIAILTVILVVLLVRPIMDYIKARLPENKRRKELRYRTIEGWVISKRIRAHDDVCAHALEHFAKPPATTIDGDIEKNSINTNIKDINNKNSNDANADNNDDDDDMIQHSLSYDTAETAEQSMELEWKECPICMEEFKADEIVSWSPDDQTSCLHFFHHECIKEWLLRSPHCPYCRGTIIPVDDCRPAKVDKLTLLEMSKRRARKAATTYCCIEHGLVHLTNKPTTATTATTPAVANTNPTTSTTVRQTHPRCRWNTRRDKIMWEAVLQTRVTPDELVAKRGGRNETTPSESGTTSSVADSELSSSILIGMGSPATTSTTTTPTTSNITLLQPEHVVPPSVLLSEMEAVAAATAAVDQDDLEAPPASGNSAPLSEEQASSSAVVTKVA